MKETLYPTLDEALYLHDVLIKKFGGATGVLELLGKPIAFLQVVDER